MTEKQNSKYAKMLKKLADKSNKKEKDLEKRVKEKQDKFSGVLNELGALFMVAKEEGVELNSETLTGNITIAELEENMTNLEITGTISKIYQPKEYNSQKGKGKLCSIILEDGKANTRLTLWNNHIKDIDKLKLEKGDKVKVSNCSTTMFRDQVQLSLNQDGKIELIKKAPEPKAITIKEIKEDMDDVRVVGRIMQIYDKRTFTSKNGKGSVLNFVLADKSGTIRSTAWNDLSDVLANFQTGTGVTIDGGYTKKGLNGTELHLGWNSRIIKNSSAPPMEELVNAKKTDLKNLEDLEGEKVLISGNILKSFIKKYFFLACPECRKSMKEETCACGFKGKPEKKAFVRIMIGDSTSSSFTTLFENHLSKIMKNNLKKAVDEEMPELFSDLEGKAISLIGTVQKNDFQDTVEIKTETIAIADEKIMTKEILSSVEASFAK